MRTWGVDGYLPYCSGTNVSAFIFANLSFDVDSHLWDMLWWNFIFNFREIIWNFNTYLIKLNIYISSFTIFSFNIVKYLKILFSPYTSQEETNLNLEFAIWRSIDNKFHLFSNLVSGTLLLKPLNFIKESQQGMCLPDVRNIFTIMKHPFLLERNT
jgi:hypothetical protein